MKLFAYTVNMEKTDWMQTRYRNIVGYIMIENEDSARGSAFKKATTENEGFNVRDIIMIEIPQEIIKKCASE